VFLLLLCNDKAVLGPWVNRAKTNIFTATVIAILITLSVILTASVLFPAISAHQIVGIMIACTVASVLTGGYLLLRAGAGRAEPVDRTGQDSWRMPPLTMLAAPAISAGRKMGLTALRAYLAVAMVLVIVRIIEVALGH